METAQASSWGKFLKFYFENNRDRRTRLGVFEDGNDYWVESDLPLTGIDVDPQTDGLGLTIILGSYTHEVRNARSLTVRLSVDGDEDGIDVLDGEGRSTVLRFAEK